MKVKFHKSRILKNMLILNSIDYPYLILLNDIKINHFDKMKIKEKYDNLLQKIHNNIFEVGDENGS
jgi:hypothetical protein